MNSSNNIERFSKTVENYVKYRPNYPKDVIKLLETKCNLTHESIIADLGSGTGIFTEQLLNHGNLVFAVEPNDQMRKAAETKLAIYSQFKSVTARAEHTGLKAKSIDIITMAQAFHWVNQAEAKIEFNRILKQDGWVVLLWNIRNNISPFMCAYEKLLQDFGTDYQTVAAENNIDLTNLKAFFKPNALHIESFNNNQLLDWDGFQGRLLSTSYIPKAGTENFTSMLDQARCIFKNYHTNNHIEFLYETKVYYGNFYQ